jgi:mannobiose 2-epimerase
MKILNDHSQLLLDASRRIEADLRENVLPFWIKQAVDPAGPGFVGSLTNGLVLDRTVERGMLLTARILWTFSAAYRRYSDPAYLAMAERAYTDLTTRFLDRAHGGFVWSIQPDGAVSRDRKQVYGQAFAIYALSEFHAATGRTEPLAQAIQVFRLVEQHARDARHGGYYEAFGRDWKPIADMRLSAVDLNEPKSQNTHLHVMEAYANLLGVWPDAGLRDALRGLLDLILDRIIDPITGHLGLFFADDWQLRYDRRSYGHDIETSWLLTDAAARVKDPALTARIRAIAIKIADVTLAEGVDADGAIYNEGGPRGLTNTNKEWWPQAEAVVGFLNAYQLTGDQRYSAAALHTWDFIERRLIDREHGEWFRGVSRDGQVLADELKVGFWKCPYHNGRCGLESVRRLREIAGPAPQNPAIDLNLTQLAANGAPSENARVV